MSTLPFRITAADVSSQEDSMARSTGLMKKLPSAQVIKNRVGRILLNLATGLFTLLVISFLVLHIPAVQQRLIEYYFGRMSTDSGFVMSAESFYLWWYDRLEVEGLTITDPEGNRMVDSKSISVNFRLPGLRRQGQIHVDGVGLNGTDVHLAHIQESDTTSNLNINIFLNRLSDGHAPGDSAVVSPKVNIGEIAVVASRFSYTMHDHLDSVNTFDPGSFSVAIRDALLQQFKVIGDTIQFDVRSLQAEETNTGFAIGKLTTYFRYSATGMEFLNTDLRAGNSVVGDTIILRYDSPAALSDFIHEVRIMGRLKGTVIDPADLAVFAPEADILKHPVYLGGHFDGRISRFTFSQMALTYGKTVVAGTISLDGLPAISETFINLSLSESTLEPEDFESLLPPATYERLLPLRRLKLQGLFIGFTTDFVAQATLRGDFGSIRSDINLKVDEVSPDRSVYEGHLELSDFDLGLYLHDTTTFQSVDLKGYIRGKGLTATTADFFLDGQVDSLGVLGYDYTGIRTEARFAQNFFNGKVEIDDPNLEVSANGSIDFRNNLDQIQVIAQLDTARLRNLHLTRETFDLSTIVEIDTRGLTLDSLQGRIMISETHMGYRDRVLAVDTIYLHAQREARQRYLSLRSTFLDFAIEGDFLFTSLIRDLPAYAREFYLNIINDQDDIRDYYANKHSAGTSYSARFEGRLGEVRPLLQLLEVGMEVSPGAIVDGEFSSGSSTRLTGFVDADSIGLGGKWWLDNTLEINASKLSDSSSVLAMIYLESGLQQFSPNFATRNVVLEAIWNSAHIDFDLTAYQHKMDNHLHLSGVADFMPDSTRIRFLPSALRILGKTWEIHPENHIAVRGVEWDIDGWKLAHEDQSIGINGRISQIMEEVLRLEVSNLDLSIINSIAGLELAGTLDGFVAARDLYGTLSLENSISIDSLSVDRFPVGDISGTNLWNPAQKRFDISVAIDRNKARVLDLRGTYTPTERESPVNMTAHLDKTNIRMLEPFLNEFVSQLDGTLTGSFNIRGTLDYLRFDGESVLENGRVKVDYLNTTYAVNGVLAMTPSQIVFRNLQLTDNYKNTGRITGYILHRNFNKMRINIDGRFRNFQVMNTTARENSLFYGSGFATGQVNFFGPSNKLKITATATTEKGTRFFIPIETEESVSTEEFVQFKSFMDSLNIPATVAKKERVELTGLELDFNLALTPDAYCEIIFDLKSGDIIRGWGAGDLRLQLDTKGEFNMFGDYTISRGAYNFTLANIVNKEFSVKEGGRITWYGDPYAANLSLTASYQQLASVLPILPHDDISSVPQIRRKYPAEVLLKLDGPMLAPQIGFDITMRDLPDAVHLDDGRPPIRLKFEFDAYKTKMDEQELAKQVFSLIVLKRFSPPESFTTANSGVSLSNSVSELLSNQLSYWMSQVDENLEIDINLGSFDEEAFNTFQLRLSYAFMNGRLRVTRDGGVTNQYNKSDLASIAGDWTVDYLITPDGKFKVKMYSRTNTNPLITSTNTNSTAVTTGVSLLYTENFNQWKELLRKAREQDKAIPDEPEDESSDNDGKN